MSGEGSGPGNHWQVAPASGSEADQNGQADQAAMDGHDKGGVAAEFFRQMDEATRRPKKSMIEVLAALEFPPREGDMAGQGDGWAS